MNVFSLVFLKPAKIQVRKWQAERSNEASSVLGVTLYFLSNFEKVK